MTDRLRRHWEIKVQRLMDKCRGLEEASIWLWTPSERSIVKNGEHGHTRQSIHRSWGRDGDGYLPPVNRAQLRLTRQSRFSLAHKNYYQMYYFLENLQPQDKEELVLVRLFNNHLLTVHTTLCANTKKSIEPSP